MLCWLDDLIVCEGMIEMTKLHFDKYNDISDESNVTTINSGAVGPEKTNAILFYIKVISLEHSKWKLLLKLSMKVVDNNVVDILIRATITMSIT